MQPIDLLSPSRKGLNARKAAFAVKKYKSHRTVGTAKEMKEFIAAQEGSRASHKAIPTVEYSKIRPEFFRDFSAIYFVFVSIFG